MRINVYDSKNTQRLLGAFDTRRLPSPVKMKGHSVSFAIMPQVSCYYRPQDRIELFDRPFVDVRLTYGGLEVPEGGDGWTQVRFLVTESPLERLLMLEDFRLPGEAEHSFLSRWRHR